MNAEDVWNKANKLVVKAVVVGVVLSCSEQRALLLAWSCWLSAVRLLEGKRGKDRANAAHPATTTPPTRPAKQIEAFETACEQLLGPWLYQTSIHSAKVYEPMSDSTSVRGDPISLQADKQTRLS